MIVESGAANTAADVFYQACCMGSCQKPWTADLACTDRCKVTD